MQKNGQNPPVKKTKRPPLMSKFIVFSIAFFLVILIAGGISFMFAMREIIRENKGVELSQLLEYERLMLESSVSSEISLALMMADSPLIMEYFLDPTNSELEHMAFEEIRAYRNAFASYMIFWINDQDRLFHFNDDEPYLLDANDPDNYWYYMTLHETDIYNFNINYNPDLNITSLWINAPVFDHDGNAIGMVGTGIELSVFLDMIYKDHTVSVTGKSGRIDFYFFNEAGEITGAQDVSLVANKVNIEEHLGDAGTDVVRIASRLWFREIHLLDTSVGRLAINAIPLLDWYAVAISLDSSIDYENSMTMLFLVVLIVMALVFIIFNIFIASLLYPLHRSVKEAEHANKAKSHFLSTMSHEMRTPINAVIGMTTIGKHADNIERKDYAFDKIDSASKHLLGVINDVLDMTKIEADKLELSLIEYDFEQMIQKVLTVINFKIQENEQDFTLSIDDDVPRHVFGDDQHLTQVIINLLSNAVKFTPKHGSIGMYITLLEEIDNMCEIQFVVSDTGIGISADQQAKLFSAFVQAESGISREFGGTGLGLAISKHIVELMGGTIRVESELGDGTSFIFTAKLKRLEKSSEAQVVIGPFGNILSGDEVIDETKVIPGEFEGKQLLLAEDVDINREIVISLLEGSGLLIDIAENGLIALETLEAAPDKYDIVFMDMQMPKMDGLEATRRIRSSELIPNKDLPIIAMTANVFQSDIDNCLEAGMNCHLGKPLDIAEVIRTLRRYLFR